MKNEALYRKKIKALLKGLSKHRSAARRSDDDLLRLVIGSILSEDAADRQAEKALAAIGEEFVDCNELRVALARELGECIGKDYPNVRAKAERIKLTLNNIFGRFNRLAIDSLGEVPKRELRRRLEELGLSSYAACCVAMFGFDVPGVPVDDSLAGCLEMKGCVESGSSQSAVRAFLEKVVPQKDAPAAHLLFRKYVEQNAKALAKKRAAEAKARAEAEAKAKAEAEAKAKAKAEAAAKAGKKGEARKARKKAAAGKKRAKRAKAARRTRKAAGTVRAAKSKRPGSKKKKSSRSAGKAAAKK